MKKKVIPAIFIIVLIIIIGAIYAGQIVYQHYSYSTEKVDLNSYFKISDAEDTAIILHNSLIKERARLIDGYYYMDFDSVQKYLNDRFYYGTVDDAVAKLKQEIADMLGINQVKVSRLEASSKKKIKEYICA